MKSLRSQMTLIAVVPVIIGTILIGMLGFWSVNRLTATYSEEILISIGDEQRSSMEKVFENIRHSAGIMQNFVQREITSLELLHDEDFMIEFLVKANLMAENLAVNTGYADSLYIRFNPEITGGKSGIFYIREEETWRSNPLTDLSDYENVDTDQLVWWIEPIEKKEAVWVSPHMDNVLLADTLSYCVPLYLNDTLVCVLGVDTRISVLSAFLKEISLYKSAASFLTDKDGYIIYHPEQNEAQTNYLIERDGTEIADIIRRNPEKRRVILYSNPDGDDFTIVNKPLECGLHLIVAARNEEIYEGRQQLLHQMSIAMGGIVILLSILVQFFINRLVNPIHNLIQASEKISRGDIDHVQLEELSRDDEIGSLNESLKGTIQYLRKYINRVNALAYSDLMTGVRNRTSYLEKIGKLNEEIRLGHIHFAVAVFDVNNLKIINDTLGHEYGDQAIRKTSQLICNHFKNSDVYRIGGDEFVVILEGDDYKERKCLIDGFKAEIKAEIYLAKGMNLQVAAGISECEEGDIRYDDVFNRADKAMYENKKELKKQ